MKKVEILFLVLMMALSLSACTSVDGMLLFNGVGGNVLLTGDDEEVVSVWTASKDDHSLCLFEGNSSNEIIDFIDDLTIYEINRELSETELVTLWAMTIEYSDGSADAVFISSDNEDFSKGKYYIGREGEWYQMNEKQVATFSELIKNHSQNSGNTYQMLR